jgi:hypothetical protein
MPGTFERPDPSLIPTGRPRCPKCQKRMIKIAIRTGLEGQDISEFNCAGCGKVGIDLGALPRAMNQSLDLPNEATALIVGGRQ